MRTFLAVEIPEQTRKSITGFVEAEKKDLPVKWVARENLHVTMKFLGEIDEKQKDGIAETVQSVCTHWKHFDIRLGRVGCFPHPAKPRVLWIGVDTGSDDLIRLEQTIDDELTKLGFEKDRRFHPHVTIGRVKKPCSVESVLARAYTSGSFPVTRVTFFKSTLKPEGPVYTPLGHMDLMK
jgi:2'-5' RNA ligase